MDVVTIEGVRPWDGRFEVDFDAQPLTTREWGWIKRFSGYLPGTSEPGFDGADPELVAVFGIIALHRLGRIRPADAADLFERFQDAPAGSSVVVEFGAREVADPADPPQANERSRTSSDGPGSKTSSETSEPTPPRSGTRGSDTSESRQPASVT